MKNGTMEMAVSTANYLTYFVCEKNKVRGGRDIAPIAAWTDITALMEVAVLAIRKNKIEAE